MQVALLHCNQIFTSCNILSPLGVSGQTASLCPSLNPRFWVPSSATVRLHQPFPGAGACAVAAAELSLCSSGQRIPIQCQTNKASGGSRSAQLIRAALPGPKPQEEQRQREGKGFPFQTQGQEKRKNTQLCQDGLHLEKTITDNNKVLESKTTLKHEIECKQWYKLDFYSNLWCITSCILKWIFMCH